MPIIGVSRREDAAPRFKTLGKLKKGAPKGASNRPRDLTYFRFDSEIPGALKAFSDAYGGQPDRLTPIYLPYVSMEENFSSWRELYGQNGLCKVRCDGDYWVDWIIDDRHYHGQNLCTKGYKDTENRCPDCPLKPVGRLSVILPELWYAGYIGLVTLETHSWNDIATISAKLVQWEPLQGRPFTIWREDTRIGVPIKGKRAAIEKSLIKIELTDERLMLTFEAAKKQSLEQVQAPQLPEPEAEEWQEVANLEAELSEPPSETLPWPDEDDDAWGAGENEPVERIGKDPAELVIQGIINSPPPEGDWTQFFKDCVERLNYDNTTHASKTKDQVWLKDPRPTWDELWAYMVEHQQEAGRL